MRRTTTAVCAAALMTAALTACSNSSDAKPAPSKTVTAPATAPAKPAAAPTPPGPKAIGKTRTYTSNDKTASFSATVISYTQPVKGIEPPGDGLGVPAGSVWGKLTAKVCNVRGPAIWVTQQPWSLAFADGTRTQTTGLNGGDFPKPEFPQDVTVNPGDCVKGNIEFPVAPGQRPAKVIYAPDDSTGASTSEWTVPKA